MGLTRNQQLGGRPRRLDPAFESLPLGAERFEEFRQLDHWNGERDRIGCSIAAKIQTL
jgi:hypothetical protein